MEKRVYRNGFYVTGNGKIKTQHDKSDFEAKIIDENIAADEIELADEKFEASTSESVILFNKKDDVYSSSIIEMPAKTIELILTNDVLQIAKSKSFPSKKIDELWRIFFLLAGVMILMFSFFILIANLPLGLVLLGIGSICIFLALVSDRVLKFIFNVFFLTHRILIALLTLRF
jgi:hypothetical protein